MLHFGNIVLLTSQISTIRMKDAENIAAVRPARVSRRIIRMHEFLDLISTAETADRDTASKHII